MWVLRQAQTITYRALIYFDKTEYLHRFFLTKMTTISLRVILTENCCHFVKNQKKGTLIIKGCFIYSLDSSNSSSLTFWSSQFPSSSRSNWTGIWTGNSNGTWTDKQSSHVSTAKEIRVNTLPTADILSGKNAHAWVSMVSY